MDPSTNVGRLVLELKTAGLQPGKIFLIDTQEGILVDDTALKQEYVSRKPYGEWIKEHKNAVDSWLEAIK